MVTYAQFTPRYRLYGDKPGAVNWIFDIILTLSKHYLVLSQLIYNLTPFLRMHVLVTRNPFTAYMIAPYTIRGL